MKPDSENNNSPLQKTMVLLTDQQRKFILSPLSLMVTLVVCIFMVELFVNVMFDKLSITGWVDIIIDSFVLTATLFTILYYYLFKPLVVVIDDYKANEMQLKSYQKHLKRMIEDLSTSETQLRETKAILQAAMDQSPVGIAVAQAPDGILRYVNEAGLSMRGGDYQSIVEGVGIDQYVASWQLKDLNGQALESDEVPLTRAIRYGEKCCREIIIRRGADDDRFVIVNAAPIWDGQGAVMAAVAVFSDITERKQAEDELQASEEKFRALFESASDGIILVSPQGVILSINAAFARMHGYSSEEMILMNLKELDSPDSNRLAPERMQRLLAGEQLTFEVEHYCKNGTLIPIEVSANKLMVGNQQYILGFHRDISEHKRSQAELISSLSLLNATLESSADGIIVVDLKGTVVRWNQKFIDLWHVPREQLYLQAKDVVLTHVVSLVDPPEEFVDKVLALYENPQNSSADMLNLSDGRVFRWYSQPQRIGQEIVGRVWSFHDITERKQVEKKLAEYQNNLEQMVRERSQALVDTSLRLKEENVQHIKAQIALFESEDRFRQIFEQSEDAIVLISPQDYAIINVNPTAERIFRKSQEELKAGGIAALCDAPGHKALLSALQQINLDSNVPGRVEKFEFTVAPDTVRLISFRGKLITLQGAEVIYSTFRDITNRIRLEEQALEIQARLIQANRMTSLGTMVSSVAHEINNPNNFLLMNAGIIKRAWDDIAPVVEEHYQSRGDFSVAQSTWSEARIFLPDAIEGIQQGALRISSIVGNLKAYGRDDRFILDSVADANAVVRLSISILSHLISSSTRKFSFQQAEWLPQVRGSARQLEQVVINLIQNALLSLPDAQHGVSVSTALDPAGGLVLIRISDEGSGIAPEIAARIMEPFFTTRLEHGGTGLGLAISSTIVKEHGGSIEFTSEPGRGTTFTVRLLPVEPSETTAS